MSSVTRVKQGRSGAAVTVSCRVGVAGRSVAWEGVGAGGDAALPSTGERREPGGGGGAAEAGRRRAGGNAYDRDAGGRRAVVHAGAGGNKHHSLRRGNGGADAAGGSASGGWSRAAAANENVLACNHRGHGRERGGEAGASAEAEEEAHGQEAWYVYCYCVPENRLSKLYRKGQRQPSKLDAVNFDTDRRQGAFFRPLVALRTRAALAK